MRRQLIALVGATASGKTAASVAVSSRLPVEVVSADSRQLRSEMCIGTAAPTQTELSAVPHHLVGIIAPDQQWTLADFLRCAREALEDIWGRERIPLLVGGSGQYLWSLLEGLTVPAVPPNVAFRKKLEMYATEQGRDAVHALLETRDPASARRIDPRNVRRVIRALEIIDAIGAPVPPDTRVAPDFQWKAIGIGWPREQLYKRADARVDEMYELGLVNETQALIDRYGTDFDALKSIGYAEAARILTDGWDHSSAVERTKIQTHRLIRRQSSWFRADDIRIDWHDGANLNLIVDTVVDAYSTPVR